MINNYLYFCKEQRKRYLKNARRCLRAGRCYQEEWMQGYKQGLQVAYDFSSRSWRRLQKDIEARNNKGFQVASVHRSSVRRLNQLS